MSTIEMWKVQAAIRLLGFDPETVYALDIRVGVGELVHTARHTDRETCIPIDGTAPEDTRMHVLAIDPEDGRAELNPVFDGDVKYFCGAGMYLAGGSKYANGTLMPIFKKADPE